MPARTLATSPSSKTSSPQSAKRCAAQPQSQAVLYARVSSKDQEKEGFSIPAQQRLLREYALEKDLAIPMNSFGIASTRWKKTSRFRRSSSTWRRPRRVVEPALQKCWPIQLAEQIGRASC